MVILASPEFPLSDYGEPDCGLFLVDCTYSPPRIHLGLGGFDTSLDSIIRDKNCFDLGNSSLPYSPFSSFTISPILNIFLCSKFLHPNDKVKVQDYFKHYRNDKLCDAFTFYYRDQDNEFPINIPENCSVIQMPVKFVRELGDLFQ
ncbi:hypothetical protein CDL12_13995 [Handroanthus impetiginosus]|uniref:Uncharacterized protein n=1 Tax=Handroanthus impetiginosus TaxID=429701 RepID=A0A2G9H7B6_9LAMI|nr:hypothetical protein CDL12_13995 [Handroanthus impetiginosus]